MSARVSFCTGSLRFSPLKFLALSLEDVRILSGAVAGALGPAALWVGAGLRAHL